MVSGLSKGQARVGSEPMTSISQQTTTNSIRAHNLKKFSNYSSVKPGLPSILCMFTRPVQWANHACDAIRLFIGPLAPS